MIQRTIGFFPEERQVTDYRDYEGQWVVVGDGDVSVGRAKEVYPNTAIMLMPYYAITPGNDRSFHEIVRTGAPYRVPINERTKIRPTSEELTQQHCDNLNQDIGRELILKRLEFHQKTMGVRLEESFVDGSGI